MSLTDEHLVALASGELSGIEADRLRELVRSNPQFAQRFAAIDRALTALGEARANPSVFDVAPELLARLQRTVPGPQKSVARAVSEAVDAIAERVATLVFDSFRTTPTLALRGTGRARLVEFEADEVRVDLHIEQDDIRSTTVISGEIISSERIEHVEVRNIQTGRSDEVSVSADGFFDVEVPSGEYRLMLAGPRGRVVIDCVAV